ncbi:MAG: shikimate dehydrogenase [Micrococcales bacterium]|nr:shikimate dehydrogenase [Micrococcales bacterium]
MTFTRRRAAVLGHPVVHSLSPLLHRAAYEALGIAPTWEYEKFDVAEEALEEFLGLVGALGPLAPSQWAGFSFTMPLKRRALALADHASPLAEATGVANTWSRDDDGWLASNTDVLGIASAMGDAHARLRSGAGGSGRPSGQLRRGVILGGGATAASAVAAFSELGVRRTVVWARSRSRAAGVAVAAARLKARVQVQMWEGPGSPLESLTEADVVVSTLPARGADELADILKGGGGSLQGRILLDVVYDPWPTALAQAWEARGGTVVAGLEMLIAQAARQVELMTGLQAPQAAMAAAVMGY